MVLEQWTPQSWMKEILQIPARMPVIAPTYACTETKETRPNSNRHTMGGTPHNLLFDAGDDIIYNQSHIFGA
jgi:hypothetical protein